jgi:hypothetical protein
MVLQFFSSIRGNSVSAVHNLPFIANGAFSEITNINTDGLLNNKEKYFKQGLCRLQIMQNERRTEG